MGVMGNSNNHSIEEVEAGRSGVQGLPRLDSFVRPCLKKKKKLSMFIASYHHCKIFKKLIVSPISRVDACYSHILRKKKRHT